jgi:hypothetical protein
MSAVSLTAVGQLKGQTAPYSLASITGTVYDSAGTTFTIPTPKSLVFFRGKTFTAPYTVPNMVNPISAVAGNGQVSLSWSAPYNGGSSITGYTVKYSNGTVITTTAAGTTSYTVTGLTNGTSYTFIVTANNIAGSSLPNSSPSATPMAPFNPTITYQETGGDYAGWGGGAAPEGPVHFQFRVTLSNFGNIAIDSASLSGAEVIDQGPSGSSYIFNIRCYFGWPGAEYGYFSQDFNLEFNINNTYQFNRTITGSANFIWSS